MAAKDPTTRRIAAKVAINTRYARMSPADRTSATEAARAAYTRQLEDEIDPRRELDPEDLAQRVTFLRRARLAALSLKAVKAREARRAARMRAEADADLDELIAAGQDAA